ncbi:hypothetical protein Pfo_014084 [Paulownia fortunei]|nr:hypothetical protein Pfo_014084 [Paulownia fortunei]
MRLFFSAFGRIPDTYGKRQLRQVPHCFGNFNKKMNLSQNPKNHSYKIHKKRLNQDQVRLLEATFDATKKLEPERKFQLARELGVPPRQIAIWYQNKRARWKNQSLELDYGSLQVRLEAALAEKEQLEKEQAHQAGTAPPVSSLSSCCDEGAGSSSLNDDVGCSANWANGEALQFEELYACLMVGAAKGSNCGPIPDGVNERDFWV